MSPRVPRDHLIVMVFVFQNASQAVLDGCRGVGATKSLQKKADAIVQYLIILGFKIYRNASTLTHLEKGLDKLKKKTIALGF